MPMTPEQRAANEAKRHPPFQKGDPKVDEYRQKGAFVKRRMREWREANPDAPLTHKEREKLIREALREATPDILDVMIDVAQDPAHKDFATTARALVEHDLGKPKQAVELTGKDGGPVELESPRDRIAERLAGIAARGAT